MLVKHTFHGTTHRVQFKVIAHDAETIERQAALNPDLPRLEAAPSFTLHMLPNSAAPNTGFHRGKLIYNGTSFDEAWDALMRYIPATQVPEKLKPFDIASPSK
jgi:hypothetical protein